MRGERDGHEDDGGEGAGDDESDPGARGGCGGGWGWWSSVRFYPDGPLGAAGFEPGPVVGLPAVGGRAGAEAQEAAEGEDGGAD